MDSFQLTEDAILDIDAIWLYLLEKEGVETADRIVTELFSLWDLHALHRRLSHRGRSAGGLPEGGYTIALNRAFSSLGGNMTH